MGPQHEEQSLSGCCRGEAEASSEWIRHLSCAAKTSAGNSLNSDGEEGNGVGRP